jgi:hypothetical protein
MTKVLKLAVWNANGLCHHAQEVRLFIQTLDLDILLVSETHFTERSHISIPTYTIYHTAHPDETAHGGTAVIIRQNLKHYVCAEYRHEHIQATTIAIEDNLGEITITAVYCPPKHNNKYNEYERFFKTLGHRFIAGGDFNAKNTFWGSRLTTTKGRELHTAMRNNNLQHLSTGQPTYWPSDTNKMPDLLDFCIVKGIPTQKFTVESCLDLTSDHTPILINMFSHIIGKPKRPSLCNQQTDWDCFRDMLDDRLNLQIPLQTQLDIEDAVACLTHAIQQAAWQATPHQQGQHIQHKCPTLVKQKLAEKRKARKTWQLTRAHNTSRYTTSWQENSNTSYTP